MNFFVHQQMYTGWHCSNWNWTTTKDQWWREGMWWMGYDVW